MTQNGSNVGTKTILLGSQGPIWALSQNRPLILTLQGAKGTPKWTPKWIKNLPIFGAIFEVPFRTPFGPLWLPKWYQKGTQK